MKRFDSLISFSHDHHHALSQARRLIRAAHANEAGRLAAARTFLRFFSRETLAHFHDEEQRVFPCAAGSDSSELHVAIARALQEHAQIQGGVLRLQADYDAGHAPDPGEFRTLGELLTSHIRFEERVVFELLQAHVAEQTLIASVGERVTADDSRG